MRVFCFFNREVAVEMTATTTTGIRISPQLWAEFFWRAAKSGKTRNGIMVDLVRDWVVADRIKQGQAERAEVVSDRVREGVK